MNNEHWNAFLLTLISGLSTTWGGIFVIMFGNPKRNTIGFLLAFASGVMLYVSIFDLIPEAQSKINNWLHLSLSFIIGCIIMYAIIHFIPDDIVAEEEELPVTSDSPRKSKLLRTGFIIVVAISIHNFPEGITVYLTALTKWKLGITIAIAIALHNFPEGMALSAPIYSVTGSKWTTLKWCMISGLCEPIGAVVFMFFFHKFIGEYAVAYMLASVSGIMVSVCVKELIPTAISHSNYRTTVVAHIVGGAFLHFCSMFLTDSH